MSANRERYNINIINNYTDSDAMLDITNNTLEIKISDKIDEIIKTMQKLQYLKDQLKDI